jgi:hypothetical protein
MCGVSVLDVSPRPQFRYGNYKPPPRPALQIISIQPIRKGIFFKLANESLTKKARIFKNLNTQKICAVWTMRRKASWGEGVLEALR